MCLIINQSSDSAAGISWWTCLIKKQQNKKHIFKFKSSNFWVSQLWQCLKQIKPNRFSHEHAGNNLTCRHFECAALIRSDAMWGLILAKECSEAPSKTGQCTFNTCISCYSPEFVSQANYAAKIDLNRGVLRGTCQWKIFSSLPSLLLFPNEGVGLCRTNRPASFFSWPSFSSYLVAFLSCFTLSSPHSCLIMSGDTYRTGSKITKCQISTPHLWHTDLH